ncbi:hypothetical protein ACFX1T_027736 [Malus domestica]
MMAKTKEKKRIRGEECGTDAGKELDSRNSEERGGAGGGSCLWAARRDAGREIAALWQRGQRDRGGRRDAALAA